MYGNFVCNIFQVTVTIVMLLQHEDGRMSSTVYTFDILYRSLRSLSFIQWIDYGLYLIKKYIKQLLTFNMRCDIIHVYENKK